MTLAVRCHFLRRRMSSDSAPATVKADAVDVVVDDCRVVGVAHNGHVHVGHRAVVVVGATSPVAPEKADTGVAETVVNAAVEADFGSPVARRPNVEAVFEGPIPWSPEETNFRRECPGARNPKVAVRAVSPVAGNPDIARSWADGLRINWQYRRPNPNGDADSNLRSGLSWDGQESNGEEQRTDETSDTHDSHLSGVRWASFGLTQSSRSPPTAALMDKNPFSGQGLRAFLLSYLE